MSKKSQLSNKSQLTQDSQTFKSSEKMTVITPSEEILLEQNLELRNQNVEQAYHNIIKGCKELLTAFETFKYRMSVTVDHTKSEKETNLINEWICYLWNLTLTKNRFGYYMVYVSYDGEALTKFGDKLFNRMLRVVFKHTNIEATDINVENCIRLDHEASDIQPFFISRLLNGDNAFVKITREEVVPS